MTRKEKINEAKVIYDIELSAMQNEKERWKKFLAFSSEFYKYSFVENLLMFAQRPDVTMCATMEQWNSVGRWVNKGAKGIRIIDNQDDEISLKYVFDVKDTHGDSKVLFRRWKAEEQQIIDILKQYFSYDNTNDLKHIISLYVYEHFDNSKVIKGLSNEELEQLTPEFIENTINCVTYCVAKRSDIEVNEEELFSNFSNITNSLQLKLIGSIVNDFSNDILRIVEYKIRQKNKEVQNYGQTRQVWNENQKKYGRELSVQISRVSDGRNNNGEIVGERKGDNREETQDRTTIETEKSKTTDERIFSSSEIQSNDRGNDRRNTTTGNRGENLEVEEKSTSFNLEGNNVSEEYITAVLKSGGNIVNAIDKIKEILKNDTLSRKEKAKKIKEQYEWIGTGFPDEYRAEATNKGIIVTDNVHNAEITISWLSVTDRLEKIFNIKNTQLDLFSSDFKIDTNIKNEEIEEKFVTKDDVITTNNEDIEKVINELVGQNVYIENKLYTVERVNFERDVIHLFDLEMSKIYPLTRILNKDIFYKYYIQDERNTELQQTKSAAEDNKIKYEIPEQPEKINYRTPSDFTKTQNLKVKYEENVEAIKLLKQLEQDKRLATKEEQEILAKYNGWGGLAKVFDSKATEWKKEYDEL